MINPYTMNFNPATDKVLVKDLDIKSIHTLVDYFHQCGYVDCLNGISYADTQLSYLHIVEGKVIPWVGSIDHYGLDHMRPRTIVPSIHQILQETAKKTKGTYPELLYYVHNEDQMCILVGVLHKLGLSLALECETFPCYVVTDSHGNAVIKEKPEGDETLQPSVNTQWMNPELYNQKETITIDGKTYIKEEALAILKNLNTVD